MRWIQDVSVRMASLAVLAVVLAACSGATQAPAQPTAVVPAAPAATPASGNAAAPPASGQPAAGAPKSSKDTLTIVMQANQGTLDPHFAATNQEMLVTRNIYNGLLKYKPDTTELTGDLATNWDTSADGLTLYVQATPGCGVAEGLRSLHPGD